MATNRSRATWLRAASWFSPQVAQRLQLLPGPLVQAGRRKGASGAAGRTVEPHVKTCRLRAQRLTGKGPAVRFAQGKGRGECGRVLFAGTNEDLGWPADTVDQKVAGQFRIS